MGEDDDLKGFGRCRYSLDKDGGNVSIKGPMIRRKFEVIRSELL